MTLFLLLVLVILLLLLGGKRGIRSIKALLLNGFIALVSIYLICFRVPVLVVMVLSSLLFALVTLFYQNHYNKKTLASFIATLITLVLMSGVIYFFCIHAQLIGVNEFQFYDEEYDYIGAAVNLNLLQILITSLIWGELGAIVDTSISISSAMQEIEIASPSRSPKHLIKSGMIIGKDIMGTTVNTLFFVALGECTMLALLYMASDYTWEMLINSKSFFQEIAGVLLSCTGCVIIIPITAGVYSILEEK